MKKLLITLLIVLCVSAAAYLVYLNEAVLPQKIKEALITGLEKSTGKHVAISSAKLELFKGLVIKDLTLDDEGSAIISAKEVTCRFLVIPIFKKEIVMTSMRLDSPRLLVERFPDNSVNIVELFFKKPIKLIDGRYALTISRISISRGEILFIDKTIEEPAAKELKKADVDVRFSPYRINFNADFELASRMPTLVKASGEYLTLKRELSARIEAKDLYPRDFVKYCDEKKFNLPDGKIDMTAALDYKDSVLNADADISGADMKFSKIPPAGKAGGIDASLSGTVKAKIKYDLSSKELIYSGTATVKNLALYNIGKEEEKIYDIRGNVSFSDKSFLFNDITATVFGVPVKAHTVIKDLKDPVLNIDVVSDVKLSVLKSVLKNRFGIDIPLEMAGDGNLKLYLEYRDLADPEPAFKGSLEVKNAVFKSEYGKAPLEDVTGRFDFTQNQLAFKDLELEYDKTAYLASGVVTNFKSPGVQLSLSSDRLSLKALFSINDKKITLSSLAGHYDAYGFSAQGLIDTTDPKNPAAQLNGTLAFGLSENKEPYKSFKDRFKGLKPSGDIRADFTIDGNLSDIPHSAIDVDAKCDRLLVNDIRLDDFASSFSCRSGMYNIKRISARVYGGAIEGNGLLDLTSKDMSYQINIDAKNIKLGELKRMTPFKDKDISGMIQMRFGMKGFSDDLARFSAWGKINISKGRLWELNLFRGIGTLVFRSDFNSVVFEEGSCDFFVKDKALFTNNLMLKSSLLNLYGAVKLSFDKRITASLKTEFTDEGVDAARTSGIAGAIERYSVIEANGSFDEPNCKVRPDLTNVAIDIASSFMN